MYSITGGGGGWNGRGKCIPRVRHTDPDHQQTDGQNGSAIHDTPRFHRVQQPGLDTEWKENATTTTLSTPAVPSAPADLFETARVWEKKFLPGTTDRTPSPNFHSDHALQ